MRHEDWKMPRGSIKEEVAWLRRKAVGGRKDFLRRADAENRRHPERKQQNKDNVILYLIEALGVVKFFEFLMRLFSG